MFNGVKLGDIHNNDYNLVISQKEISPPDVKNKVVDIPGADGSLDLTETLTNSVLYKNRSLEIKLTSLDSRNEFQGKVNELINKIHGQKKRIMFDDAQYFYEGRIYVDKLDTDVKKRTVTVKADVEPYKREKYSSLEPWDWDSFSFIDGIIREYKDIVITKTKTLNIIGRRMPVVPIIECSDYFKVKFNGVTYNLNPGTNALSELATKEGDNKYYFIGSGTISVDYRGGKL